MQDSLAQEPNKPRRIIRVFDLKIIHYCQIALSSKQPLRSLPVLLENVGRSPGEPNKGYTASTTCGLNPLMHCEHAGKEGGVTTNHHDLPLKHHHEQTEPGGGLLLGLLTLLTMQRVNAEGQRAQEQA